MYYFSKKIKNIIAGNFNKKILFFLGTVVFIITIFSIIAYIIAEFNEEVCIINEGQKAIKDPFWWVFLHISYPGHLLLDTESHWWMRLLAVIITLLGMLFFEGILISFLVHELREKVESYKKGHARFSFVNQYVIIGWNSFAVSLIKNIFAENDSDKSDTEIIILSNKESENIQNKIKSSVTVSEYKNIFVFSGELIKNEFSKLSLPSAKEIHILGEEENSGNNNKNIQILFEISELMPEKKENKIDCFLNLPEVNSFSILKNMTFPAKVNNAMNIRPFNLYQGWARMLWGSIDLSYRERKYNRQDAVFPLLIKTVELMEEKDYFHLVIVGFNEMGRLLLEHSLQMAHFASKKPSLITVIDNDLKLKVDRFNARFPNYKNIDSCKVNFFEADIYSEFARNILLEECNNPNCRLAVVVCNSNSDEAFLSAELLPSELIEKKVPIMVFQQEGLGYNFLTNKQNDQENVFRKKMSYYGWLDEHSDLIKVRERLAEGIHNNYLEYLKTRGGYNSSNLSHQEWENLPHNYKWSNRYQADSFILKLSVAGKKIEFSNNDGKLYEFSGKELNRLAEMEHERWCAEKFLDGWEFGEIKKDTEKTHPDLIPFEKLSDARQKLDKNAVQVMPRLLKENCNFDIVELSKK